MNKIHGNVVRTVSLIAILILSAVFSRAYVDASTVNTTGPRILVKAGEKITVQFETSKTVPAVKIELCSQNTVNEQCVLLKAVARGITALVQIPSNYPSGRAVIRVTGRDTHLKLLSSIRYEGPVLVKGKSVSTTSCGLVTPSGPTITEAWITGTVESVRKICDGNYEIIVTNGRVGGPTQASDPYTYPIRIRTQPTTAIIEVLTVDNPPHIGAWQIQAGDKFGTAYGVYSPSDHMMIQTKNIGVESDRFVYSYHY